MLLKAKGIRAHQRCAKTNNEQWITISIAYARILLLLSKVMSNHVKIDTFYILDLVQVVSDIGIQTDLVRYGQFWAVPHKVSEIIRGKSFPHFPEQILQGINANAWFPSVCTCICAIMLLTYVNHVSLFVSSCCIMFFACYLAITVPWPLPSRRSLSTNCRWYFSVWSDWDCLHPAEPCITLVSSPFTFHF